MPIKSLVRTVPHYPKPGIMFRDITTVLKDPVGLRATIDELARRYADVKIDKIAAIESRGFIIDLPGIGGSKRLEKHGHKVFALCEFEDD